MRILHVIHSLDPRSGGPSLSLRHLARQQADRGHQVTILTSDAQSAEPWAPERKFRQQLLDDPVLEPVKVIIEKGYGRFFGFSRYRYTPGARDTIEKMFESSRHHPDVVHIHGLYSHLTMLAGKLAYRWRIPFVLRPAGGLNVFSRKRGNTWGKSLLYRMRERRNLERSLFVHATSQREHDELRGLLPDKRIEVVPHGTVIPNLQDNSYSQDVFFRKFPMLKDRRVVLFLSRLAEKKRLDLLIEAFDEARRMHPDLALAIAGPDAGYRHRAAVLIRRRKLTRDAHFLGFLAGTLKEGAFAAASFLALPSEDENFGLVVVEAMAHGLPVVVSDGVDSHLYVREARAGVVVKPSAASLTKGMLRILEKDLAAMGTRGREYAETHLSWDRIVERLEELYVRR